MAGNAVPQAQELAQEGLLGPPEQGHVGAILTPAQHCAQGDDEDVVQIVARVVLARVLQPFENLCKLLHDTAPVPTRCPVVESRRPSPCKVQFSNAIPLAAPSSSLVRQIAPR